MSFEEFSESSPSETSVEPAEPELPSMRGANEFESAPEVSKERHTSVEAPKEVWWRRFTVDLYDNEQSAVRELVSNASTAVVRAEEMYDVSNGVVEVTLIEDEDEEWFVIRDNGIGMSWAIIDGVLSTIGETTAFDEGDKAGKWGMGFFSSWMICGVQGSFPMYTRPRDPERGYVQGVWVPGDFYEDTSLTGGLEEDEYGTLIRIPLAETTEFDELRDGLYKFSEWSRVPIRFEYWRNGDLHQEEEFGSKRLIDTYDADEPVVTVEHDEFIAHASESASGRILLLDYITRGSTSLLGNDLPSDWNVDIRLKNENGVVVNCDCEDCDHMGLMPVDNEQYENLPEEKRDECVRRADLTDNDVTLPEPNASRDHVDVTASFKEYLYARLEAQYDEMMEEVVEQVDSREDFLNLDPHHRALFAEEIFSESESVIENNCEGWGWEIDDDLRDEFALLMENVSVAKRDCNIKGRTLNQNQYTKERIWTLLAQEHDTDGEVFMGATLWQPRCDVVWDDNEDNIIIEVESGDYGRFESSFGWRRVTEIKQKTIDEFDVSDEVAAAFKSDSSSRSSTSRNAGLPPEMREIKVHRRSYGGPRTYNVGDVADDYVEALKNGNDSPHRWDTLVLYPSDAEYNISDNEWLINSDVAAANCTKMVYEFLEEFPGVEHINDYMEQGADETVTLPTGEETTLDSVASGNSEHTVFHALPDKWRQHLVNQDEEVIERFVTESASSLLYLGEDDEVDYAFASPDALRRAEPYFHETDATPYVATGVAGEVEVVGTRHKRAREASAFLHARLNEWVGKSEFRALSEMVGRDFSQKLLDTIALATPLHDKGMEPASSYLNNDHSVEPTILTSKGKLPVSEALESGTPVFHVLDANVIELFRDAELMPRFTSYIRENSGGYNDTDLSDAYDMTYIPVTDGKLSEIAAFADETLEVVYGSARARTGNTQNIGSDYSMYAYARLSEWDGEPYFNTVVNNSQSLTGDGWYLLETLCQLHDMGLTPDEGVLDACTDE